MKKYFELDGMTLCVSKHHLSPKITEAILSGRFEGTERRAIKHHIEPSDRVLDLGGGIGCTGVVAGRIVNGENLMIVEANEDLIEDIQENLAANLIFGATVVNGAIVAQKKSETVTFHKSKAFWARSLVSSNAPNVKAVEVPALILADVVVKFKPTIIMCDVEGLETQLFSEPLPDHVRMIMMELHPNLYDQQTIKDLFDALSIMGFSYVPRGSHGAVVCFGRKKRP